MISLRELLAYGKAFMEEENQDLDSGGEFDLEGWDRQEHCQRIILREERLGQDGNHRPPPSPALPRVLSPPGLPSLGSGSSSVSSTPTVLQQRARQRPVYLCEEHMRERVRIEITGPPPPRPGEGPAPELPADPAGLTASPGFTRSFTSEGTQTEYRGKRGRTGRREERERGRKERSRRREEEEAERYRKLSVQEAVYRKLSQQYEESSDLCAAYGLDSLSQDSGEDGKADDMNEMDMPNPGSIQHFERLFYPSIPCKNCSTCYVKYEQEIFWS